MLAASIGTLSKEKTSTSVEVRCRNSDVNKQYCPQPADSIDFSLRNMDITPPRAFFDDDDDGANGKTPEPRRQRLANLERKVEVLCREKGSLVVCPHSPFNGKYMLKI